MAGFTPFREDDPMENVAGTERLRLFDGILLTADHFRTEQLYHRARLARLLGYLHGAGTVAGLDVVWRDAGGGAMEVVVSPGIAIDYRGRILEMGYESCLDIADWTADALADPERSAQIATGRRGPEAGLPDHFRVDIFAEFAAFARRPEPAFATGNADQIDGTEATLAQDSLYLNMVIRDAGAIADPATDLLPESMISRLVPGAVDAAAIQAAKRQTLWRALAPRPDTLAPSPDQPVTEHDLTRQAFGGVFLARLAIPLRLAGTALEFDDAFDLTAPAAQPSFAGRLYSYSTAELALLAGERR